MSETLGVLQVVPSWKVNNSVSLRWDHVTSFDLIGAPCTVSVSRLVPRTTTPFMSVEPVRPDTQAALVGVPSLPKTSTDRGDGRVQSPQDKWTGTVSTKRVDTFGEVGSTNGNVTYNRLNPL